VVGKLIKAFQKRSCVNRLINIPLAFKYSTKWKCDYVKDFSQKRQTNRPNTSFRLATNHSMLPQLLQKNKETVAEMAS